jgi:hypothetical protein
MASDYSFGILKLILLNCTFILFYEEVKSTQSMDVDNKERNIIQTGMNK